MIQTAQSTAGFLPSLMAIIPPKSSARIILGEMILTVTCGPCQFLIDFRRQSPLDYF